MSKKARVAETPAQRKLFLAKQKYRALRDNLLGLERKALVDENQRKTMQQEVDRAQRDYRLAEAEAAY